MKMRYFVHCFALLLVAAACQQPSHTQEAAATEQDTVAILQNPAVQLTVQLEGGAFTNFQHKKRPVNPLTWALSEEQMPENNRPGAPFRGHFLCLGRWGSPSAAEMAAGVPHNGEPSKDRWEVSTQTDTDLVMSAEAPLDGLSIKRAITLHEQSPVFGVKEWVSNTFTLDRPFNIVQHPTIGPPFLQRSTVVKSNAGMGFNQKHAYPDPNRSAYRWPAGFKDTLQQQPINLEQTSDDNYVTTHLFEDSVAYGWVAAQNPGEQLVYGFVWNTEDYPWLNVWNHNEAGAPVAKGLEFGTAGVGRPYESLIMDQVLFKGKHSFEYLRAGDTVEKAYLCFLVALPKGFGLLRDITVVGGNQLKFIGNSEVQYPIPDGFL